MPTPLDYARDATRANARRGQLFLILSLLLTATTVCVVVDVLLDAATIWYAGLYRPGVSFFFDLPLKTYHVQRHPLVWLLPLGGAAFGVGCLAMRSVWRRWAVASIAVAVLCAIGMVLMSGRW